MTTLPRVGIVGAGTMGAGIAQVCALAGRDVVLVDVDAAAGARAIERIDADLRGGVERGKLADADREATLARIGTASALEALAAVDLVIEAAPEDLDVKRSLFARLESIAPAAILASNTSSLSITRIAAATRSPDRVAGLHFFNPAPRMPLVEVVRGHATAPATVTILVAFAREIGKSPIVAADAPGFIANRAARPFYTEALRILGDGVGDVATVDRVVREVGGYRMGPFELIDLIGVDVNLAVTRILYEGYFGEPRFRPHPIQQRMVDAGALGRKTGVGFYDYRASGTRAVAGGGTDNATAAGEGSGPPLPEPIVVVGAPALTAAIAARLGTRHDVRQVDVAGPVRAVKSAGAIVDATVMRTTKRALARYIRRETPPGVPIASLCLCAAAAEIAAWYGADRPLAAFAWLPSTAADAPIEAIASSSPDAAAATALLRAIGPAIPVGDAPGGIWPRLVAMLVNEAHFLVGEGIARTADVDRALRLGMNHPRGPFEWEREVGARTIVAILDGLSRFYGEDRYRAAPALRRGGFARVVY